MLTSFISLGETFTNISALSISPTTGQEEGQPNTPPEEEPIRQRPKNALPNVENRRKANLPRLNSTKVIRKIEGSYLKKPLNGGKTDDSKPGTQFSGENDPTVGSGIDLTVSGESSSEEPGAGIDSTTSEPKQTCLHRIKVTHGRLAQKDKSSGCRDDGKDEASSMIERLTESGESPPEDKALKLSDKEMDPQNEDLRAIFKETDHSLHKLLTDTFQNLNVTTFSIHVSEPSDLSSNAETITKQIIQGLKPISRPKSEKSLSYSDRLLTYSVISGKSQPTTASPTSQPLVSSVTNPEKMDVVAEKTVQTFNSSQTENGTPALPKEGGVPLYRRTRPTGTFSRHLRPNLMQFPNRTRLNSRFAHLSHSPLSKTNTTSTNNPLSALEKSSLSEGNGLNTDKSGVSEGEKQERSQITERGKIPVRRLPFKPGFQRQTLTNMGSFQNRSRPNYRLFRRPMRPLNNKTEAENFKTMVQDELTPSKAPPVVTKPEKVDDKADLTLTRRLNLTRTSGFGGFNRSRVAFPRRPNPYIGSFPNRTRLIMRPPQRGTIRKTLTASNGAESGSNGMSQNIDKMDFQRLERFRKPGDDEKPGLRQEKSQQNQFESGHFDTGSIGKEESNVRDTLDSPRIQNLSKIIEKTDANSQTSLENQDRDVLRSSKVKDKHGSNAANSQLETQLGKDDKASVQSGNIRQKKPNVTDVPFDSGVWKSATVSQTGESGRQSGFETGDIHSDEKDVQRSSQGVKMSQRGQTDTGRLDENSRKIPQNNQDIMGIRGPGNTGDDETRRDLTFEGDKQIEDGYRVLNQNTGKEKGEGEDSREENKNTSIVPNSQASSTATNQFEEGDSANTRSKNLLKEKTIGVGKGKANSGERTAATDFQRLLKPGTHPKATQPKRRIISQGQTRNGSLVGHGLGADAARKRGFNTKTAQTKQDDTKSGVGLNGKEDELGNFAVTNRTSDGFTVGWDAPEGKYKNFIVTGKQAEEDNEENQVGNGSSQSVQAVKRSGESLKEELPGESRSFRFEDLFPQTNYTVTVLGKGPGVLSRLHKLVISTGTALYNETAITSMMLQSAFSFIKHKSIQCFPQPYVHCSRYKQCPC